MGMFGADNSKARSAYVAFVNDGVSEGRRGEFHSGTCDGRLLGDDSFVDAALGKASEKRLRTTVDDVLDAVSKKFDCSVHDLRAPGKERPFTEARAVASLLVQERPHLSLTELGRALNRDISPLGRVGRRLQRELVQDGRLREVVERVREELRE